MPYNTRFAPLKYSRHPMLFSLISSYHMLLEWLLKNTKGRKKSDMAIRAKTQTSSAPVFALPKRNEAGLTEKHLFRGAEGPNEVIILFEAKDMKRAEDFAGSQDLRETTQKVDVVDKPDIYFLNG